MNTKPIFYSVILCFILIAALVLITNPSYIFKKHYDEIQYSNELKDWNKYGHEWFIQNIYIDDDKPLTFFYLEKLLQHDKTYLYTRITVLLLSFLISFIMFKITNRYESFLLMIFPIVFSTLWLNVEIIELFFLMLSFYYKKYSGLFVGMATIFRPYALLYTFLLNRKQALYVIIIGGLYSLYLLYLGVFFTYLNRLIYYSGTYSISQRHEIDYLGLFIIFCLAICAYKSKELFKYGVVGSIPLLLRTWSHYMITPASIFFFAYLYLNKLEDNIKCQK